MKGLENRRSRLGFAAATVASASAALASVMVWAAVAGMFYGQLASALTGTLLVWSACSLTLTALWADEERRPW